MIEDKETDETDEIDERVGGIVGFGELFIGVIGKIGIIGKIGLLA
jgi:hypothetical protein